MKPLFRGVYEKLAALLLVFFVSFGLLNGVVSLLTARVFVKEVNQRVNHDLARQLAGKRELVRNGKVNQDAARQLFDVVMTINPLAEVYVLGPDGTILAPLTSPVVRRTRVSLAPVGRMLSGGELPILGDDPRDPTGQRVFSVAPLGQSGYLYVILGGQQFESLLTMLQQSHMLRWGAWVAAGGLLFGVAAGLLLLSLSTRRIRALTAAMQEFRARGYTERHTTLPRAARHEDEIDRLSTTFQEMSSRIVEQMELLRDTDSARRELFANISHDLRTPLASLHGYLETLLLKERELSAGERRRYLEVATRRSEQLNRLVSELFELAKLESPETRVISEPVSPCDLVQDVVQKHQLAAVGKNVTIAMDMRPARSLISGDVGLLERMLDNLLENAVRFTPPGALVRVECESDAEWASIRVVDAGPGIPPHEIERIFERAYRGQQASPGRDGAGLGLAIAKRIVELHGGHIAAANVPPGGAVFAVRLPAKHAVRDGPLLEST
ncbi:MAG: HAMP domain-containing sensor histidine kinase [Acidobacteriota bacterium]